MAIIVSNNWKVLDLAEDVTFFFLRLIYFGCPRSSCCTPTFSNCGEWRPLSVVVCGLLITVASLTADQSLGTWASVAAACGLFICSSQALEVKLGSSAHGNFCCVPWEDRGWNVCPLHWWVDSYPLYHQGNPGSSVLSLSLSLSTVSLLLNSVSGELWLWPSCDHPQLWACIFPPFVLTRKSKGFSHNWGTKILGFIPLDPPFMYHYIL